MEGVSKIFGGVVDMKEGNFRQLLVALDEHQTLWTEVSYPLSMAQTGKTVYCV